MPAELQCKQRFPNGQSTKAVANSLLDWADQDGILVSPLKLQKLLFFCHAEFLLQIGLPLIRDEFEAWSYGPVVPAIYHCMKAFGSSPIDGRCREFNPVTCTTSEPRAVLGEDNSRNLKEVFQIYAAVSANMLSSLSHREGGPWARALEAFESSRNINRRITNKAILQHHNPAAT